MSETAEALHVDLGVGKTTTILRVAYNKLTKMRAAGDKRVICIAGAEHRLNAQIATSFNNIGSLSAEVWRGRGSPDPSSPGETMCRRADETGPIVEAMGSVARRLCYTCSFKLTCSYLAQSERDPDVWVVAHHVLFLASLPAAITNRGIAYLVVDESPWQAGLIGTESEAWSIPLDVLTELPLPHFPAMRLEDCRERLQRACRALPYGWVTKEALKAVGFDETTGKEVGALEGGRRVIDDGSLPLHMLQQAHHLLPQMEQVWHAIDVLMNGTGHASGWLEVIKSATGGRGLRIFGRRSLASKFRVPTLLADATYSESLVRPYWADVSPPLRISVETSHQSITQTIDRAFGKNTLLPRQGDKPEELSRKGRNLKRMRAMIYGLALQARGRVLMVSNKDFITALGILPRVETAHFNAVAGRDDWKDITDLVVIGRPLPSPSSAENLAAALTGQPIERLAGWYPQRDMQRRVSSEVIVAAEDFHPDPICEGILERIVAGELMQAIGRGRGVTRTQLNPLKVLVLTDVPLPVEIHGSVSGLSVLGEVSPLIAQLAKGGVAFESATHAAAYYPALWPSQGAAKMAFQRAKGKHGVTNPYRDPLRGTLPSGRLDEYQYQKAGERQHAATCWVDPHVKTVSRARIEDALGPLQSFELTATASRAENALRPVNWVAAGRRRRQYVSLGDILEPAPRVAGWAFQGASI